MAWGGAKEARYSTAQSCPSSHEFFQISGICDTWASATKAVRVRAGCFKVLDLLFKELKSGCI